MSTPRSPLEPQTKPVARRSFAFRKTRKNPLQTPDRSRRQASVVQSAWRHFGEPGPVIAFLNTRHAGLEGQPLELAIESDEGLDRVETLLKQMTLNA
jgi:uncharacterized protein (DUF2384 family)